MTVEEIITDSESWNCAAETTVSHNSAKDNAVQAGTYGGMSCGDP